MVVEVLIGRSRREWAKMGDTHVVYRLSRRIYLKGDPTVPFNAVYAFEAVRFRLMYNVHAGETVAD